MATAAATFSAVMLSKKFFIGELGAAGAISRGRPMSSAIVIVVDDLSIFPVFVFVHV
jgi:hypothetical protein